MTKKDFESIANLLRSAEPPVRFTKEHDRWGVLCRSFGHMCERTNEQFDIDRFLKACNVET